MNLANRRGRTFAGSASQAIGVLLGRGRARTVAGLVLVLLSRAAMAPAATFTVNSTLDALTPGFGGKAKIALKAKGAALQFPATPLADPSLHVQLQQRGSDRCWDASFGFYVLKNKVEGYKAVGN